jgi:hypothetical protein
MNRIAWVFVLAVCLMLPGMAWADIIVNGGFENPNTPASTAGFSQVPGWTITSPEVGYTVDCTTGTCGAPFYPHSGDAAIWGGASSASNAGTIVQSTITDVVGEVYSLSFWLANPYVEATPDNSAEVYWNSAPIFSETNLTNQPYTQYTAFVTGTGSDQLQFALYDAPGVLLLDDVGVNQVPDGGTTLSLLGLAIVGLAGLRRKLSL